jgi:hypothetical protein
MDSHHERRNFVLALVGAVSGLVAAVAGIWVLSSQVFGPSPVRDAKLSDLTLAIKAKTVVVTFRAEITGFKDQRCLLYWSMLDERTKTIVDGPHEILYVIPDSNQDVGNHSIEVPFPTSVGSYVVRLELYPPEAGRLSLAYKDSEPFNVYIPSR